MASFRQLKEKRDARQYTSVPKKVVPLPPNETQIQPHQNEINSSSSSTLTTTLPEPDTSEPTLLETNGDLQVRKIPGKGRGLFWCPTDGRRVGRGTTLLKVTPEVTVASSQSLETLCHKCFSSSKEGKVLQRCSGCKVLRYCSTNCQKADWPAHRQECKALQLYQKREKSDRKGAHQARAQEPGMTVRLLGRLLWERKRLGDGWWKKIEELQSNRNAVSSDSNLIDLPMRLANYLGAGPDQAGKEKMEELGLRNAAEVLDLIGRATTNSFVAYSSDLSAVGVALNTAAAMINHSCVPNVAIVYPNGPGAKDPMHVVAIRDLDPAEELTTFYTDVADPYSLRQKTLEQRYAFKCSCPLCAKSERVFLGKRTRVDAREALWCGRPGCSGWVGNRNSLCTNCKQQSTLDYTQVAESLREGKEVLIKVDNLMNEGDMKGALSAAQQTVKMLSQLQPPSAYPLLGLLRQLQTACILCATSTEQEREAVEYFEEAIRLSFVSLAGMQVSNGSVYCEGHPTRAIALATLSTLLVREVPPQEAEWVSRMASTSAYLSRIPTVPPIGRLRDQVGISLMMQSIKELKIAYGNDEEGGEPGRKLIDQVRQWKENEALMARRV